MHPFDPTRSRRPEATGLVAIAVAAVVAMVGIASRSPPAAPVASTPAPDPQVAIVTTPASPRPVVSVRPAPVASPVVSANLQREYREARDNRAFALQARARPAEGGLFYAQAAAEYCIDYAALSRGTFATAVAREIDATGSVTNGLARTIDGLQRRCASFTPNEAIDLVWSTRAESANRADPLLNLVIDAAAARRDGDLAATARGAQAAVDAGDPLLLSKHVRALMTADDADDTVRIGFAVDGDAAGADVANGALYVAAAELAACRADLPCHGDHLVATTCVLRGVCAASATDLFVDDPSHAWMFPNGSAAFRALVARLRVAFASGDARAFVAS